jgi:hypothetical protein
VQSSSNPSTRVQIPSLVASSLCSSPLGVIEIKPSDAWNSNNCSEIQVLALAMARNGIPSAKTG